MAKRHGGWVHWPPRRLFLARLMGIPIMAALPGPARGSGLEGLLGYLAQADSGARGGKEEGMRDRVVKSEEEWRRILTPEQFHVLRQKGTERAFTGKYHDFKGKGMYECAGCGNPLFSSDTKFDSGTGWPSFFAPISDNSVRTEADNSFFMRRTEVLCARCDGHLGHVFDDGPPPTKLRYCMNSAALRFVEGKDG